MAEMKSFTVLLRKAAWSKCLAPWLLPCLLLSTPFHLVAATNQAFAAGHAFVALGLIAGTVLAQAYALNGLGSNRGAWGTIVALAFAGALLVAVVPEWIAFPFASMRRASGGLFGTSEFVSALIFLRAVQPVLLLLSGASCASLLAGEPLLTDKDTGRSVCSEQFWLSVLASFAAGYLIRYSSQLVYGDSGQILDVGMGRVLGIELLMFALSLVAVAPVALRCSVRAKEGDRAFLSTVACVAGGSLLWSLMTRVVRVEGAGALPYALLALLAVAALVLSVRSLALSRRGERAGEMDGGVDERNDVSRGSSNLPAAVRRAGGEKLPLDDCHFASLYPNVAKVLSRQKLGSREREIAVATAAGVSAKEISAHIGIAPGTVRTTLQRVYGKMGVANKAGLLEAVSAELVGGEPCCVAERAKCEMADGRTGGDAESRDLDKGVEGVRCRVIRTVVLIAGCVVILPAFLPHVMPWGASRPFLYGVALGVGSFAALTLVVGKMRLHFGDGANCAFACIGIAAVGASSIFGVRIGALDVQVTFLLALFGAMLLGVAALGEFGNSKRNEKGRVHDGIIVFLCFLVAFGMGFVWEELWRPSPWRSFVQVVMPLPLIVCGAFCIWTWGRERRKEAISMGVVALLFSALRINVVPFSCAMYALCRFWNEQLGHGRVGSRDALLIVLASAMGCLAGDYAVNVAGAKLVGNDLFTTAYGGRAAYLLFVNCCFAGISVLIGACFCLALGRSREDDSAEAMVGNAGGAGERLKHALLGRGFNEVQVEVVLDIVSGKTSPEIATSRYMSRGTVNSARTAAYKALGVHSRSGLIAALSELQGL